MVKETSASPPTTERNDMTQFRMIEQEDAHSQQYRIDLPVYAYIRFSTMGQVRNSLQSKKMQDDRMNQKLQRIGFTDIRVKDKDEGISGQKGLDRRSDLADIYHAMKAGVCGAIAAYDASRLWRDRDRVHFNDFIMKIKQYNVPVILHNRTYWPKIKDDMEALRAEFEYSQKALEQFYDKANPAKQEAVLGGSYGGHAIPVGFVVIGEKGARCYCLYEPHATLIRWLFRRYRELGGNLGKLGRELVAINFHFPDFDTDALRALGAAIPHIGLHHDAQGYTLQTRGGLVSVLTNRAYLGWYCYTAYSEEARVFHGEYIRKDAHTAIVDYDDFLYAYSRLSPVTLDGEINEDKPKIDRRHGMGCDALLENILECDGAPVYVMADREKYTAKMHNGGWHINPLAVPIAPIDREFSTALRLMLIELEKRHEQGFADGLYELLTQAQETAVKESDTLAGELANVLQGIKEAELQKKVALAEGYEPDVVDAVRRLKKLNADREALGAKLAHSEQEQGDLAECQSLTEVALHQWEKMKFATKRRYVRLLVAKANMTSVSPRFLRLDIVIGTPFYRLMTGFVFRTHGERHVWTPEEEDAIRRLYPSAGKLELLQAAPLRSWSAIATHAHDMHVVRAWMPDTDDIDMLLSYADMQLMEREHIDRRGAPIPDTRTRAYPTSGWRSRELTIEEIQGRMIKDDKKYISW